MGMPVKSGNSRQITSLAPVHVKPGTKNALQPSRIGAWSPETADTQTDMLLARYPVRPISRPATPQPRG